MANVTLSYEGEKVGFVADMAYGPRADEWNGGVVTKHMFTGMLTKKLV